MISTFIQLVGCRQNNLKNFSINIPKQKITVITGVSGSGKSSLAFDLLFAEGQRRYLEYLSSQTYKLVKQLSKPDVDRIDGLSPTLAVDQRRCFLSSRGIIATYTDIYEFLALLYTKIGEQHSPVTGQRLFRHSRQEIIDLILKEYPIGTKIQLLAPIHLHKEPIEQLWKRLQQMGFIRLLINGQDYVLEDLTIDLSLITSLDVVIDRIEIKEDVRDRLAASVETAMDLSHGIVKILENKQKNIRYFTEIYVCPQTHISFSPLELSDFNFNSAKGACHTCKGLGGSYEINRELFQWNFSFSLEKQFADFFKLLPKKIKVSFLSIYETFLSHHSINKDTIIQDIPKNFLEMLLYGSEKILPVKMEGLFGRKSLQEKILGVKSAWPGFFPFIKRLLQEKIIQDPAEKFTFVEWQVCPSCQGKRLKIESLACLIKGKNISELCTYTISAMQKEINSWSFVEDKAIIAEEIISQINRRLHFLQQVGLGYLSLDRPGNTLSTGEAQRVQLASQIGIQLAGITYILDEPSLGLHRQDVHYLQQAIVRLQDMGNTIVIVEHDNQMIQMADHLIEIGPGAGINGGRVIFQGNYQEMLESADSLTGQWISGKRSFPTNKGRFIPSEWLTVKNTCLHNLKNISTRIPLGCLVGFCGVSGSGKSTLALDVIGKQLQKALNGQPSAEITGYESIHRLVFNQKVSNIPNNRSLPITYVQLMTPLRQLFAETRLAKARGYNAGRFSLNKKGGRCEACEGLGSLQVKMELIPDLSVPCQICQGQRYNYETLQITWEGKNLADILHLSFEKAKVFFRHIPSFTPTLDLMQEVGLGYLTMGQPFSTLSGGEIQRLRLVADLASRSQEKTLYILDEPSSGLHYEDIEKLVHIFHRLVEKGNSVFIIEHHLALLRQADWLIELGPCGGPEGGNLLFEGPSKNLTKKQTPTGKLI